MDLMEDIHIGLKFPIKTHNYILVPRSYLYYHYTCNGVNDVGWGCGYRTLQTICSWIKKQEENIVKRDFTSLPQVPSILEFQEALVKIGDKDKNFIGSKEWIGSVEVAYCIEHFYKIQCRLIHCRDVSDLKCHANDIMDHFQQHGSPIMMGGDRDCSSKGIFGICETENGIYLLILDPHYIGQNTSREKMQNEGWIKWQKLDDFDQHSFYNLCCPLIK